MGEIKIVTDSAADLAPELLAREGVTVVPLIVIFGEDSYEETALSRDAFWDLASGGVHPRTSQPSVGAFQSVFQEMVDQGHQVVCITVTGKHSGTFSSASLAARPFGDAVSVVDSSAFSLAQGFQVLEAARLVQEGADKATILGALAQMRDHTHILFQLDTIEFLRMGGRASKAMPAIDRVVRALKLKPLLTVVDGEIKLHGVVRTRIKGMERLVQELTEMRPFERLAVIHIRCEELGERLVDALATAADFDRAKILLGEAGSVLSCHAGPGVLALAGVRVAKST